VEIRAAKRSIGAKTLKRSFSEYKTVLMMMLCTLPISLFYSQAETNFQLHLKANFSDALNLIAWLTTAKGVMVIVLQMWIVKRTARIPTHKLILFAYVCYALAAVGYGYAPTFALLLVAQFFLTIGESLGLTHLLNMVSLIAPAHKRGRYFSLFGLHWDISRTLGPLLGGLVFVTYGGGVLFDVLAVVLLLGGMAQYVRMRIIL
jgi:predicted MFS family arabinose efflux permease